MRGFTLIEVLVVVVVLGCLGAIAVPSLLSQINKGRETEAIHYLGILIKEQKAHSLEKGNYEPDDLRKLNDINTSKAKYYEFGVDPTSSEKGVFMRATPRSEWKPYLRSFFGAVVLFQGNDVIEQSCICRSKRVIGGHLKKSDLTVISKDKTLICKNNSEPL